MSRLIRNYKIFYKQQENNSKKPKKLKQKINPIEINPI